MRTRRRYRKVNIPAVPPPDEERTRAGFTLVELVVACLVFAVGVLSLQAATLVVLRQAHDARTQSRATELAAATLERLVNLPCGTAVSGSTAGDGVTAEWSTGASAGSLATTTTQTVRFRRGPARRSDTYVGAVRCR